MKKQRPPTWELAAKLIAANFAVMRVASVTHRGGVNLVLLTDWDERRKLLKEIITMAYATALQIVEAQGASDVEHQYEPTSYTPISCCDAQYITVVNAAKSVI